MSLVVSTSEILFQLVSQGLHLRLAKGIIDRKWASQITLRTQKFRLDFYEQVYGTMDHKPQMTLVDRLHQFSFRVFLVFSHFFNSYTTSFQLILSGIKGNQSTKNIPYMHNTQKSMINTLKVPLKQKLEFFIFQSQFKDSNQCLHSKYVGFHQ